VLTSRHAGHRHLGVGLGAVRAHHAKLLGVGRGRTRHRALLGRLVEDDVVAVHGENGEHESTGKRRREQLLLHWGGSLLDLEAGLPRQRISIFRRRQEAVPARAPTPIHACCPANLSWHEDRVLRALST
jgi:hypothetical protein